jgi:hypothetical protein
MGNRADSLALLASIGNLAGKLAASYSESWAAIVIAAIVTSKIADLFMCRALPLSWSNFD